MTYGFRDLSEPKFKQQDKLERLKTGSKKRTEPTDTPRSEVDEVDPAEFFDPEEFGIRRREWHPLP